MEHIEALHGPETPLLARGHMQLSKVNRFLSRLDEALEHADIALQIAEAETTPDDPELLPIVNLVARTRVARGEFSEALEPRPSQKRIFCWIFVRLVGEVEALSGLSTPHGEASAAAAAAPSRASFPPYGSARWGAWCPPPRTRYCTRPSEARRSTP